MRTVTVYRHGATMGTPPSKASEHDRAKRGQVVGWSPSATRRNVAFLRSVKERELLTTADGKPLRAYAVTLTLKDCPATSDDWAALRRAFMRRMERRGMYRCHWVTEWQRRGVPHLHGAMWFPEDFPSGEIQSQWCQLAWADYGATDKGQHVMPITDALGWFKYLAKHAARGVSHYQRNSDNMPEGWQTSGRIWGHTGDWPTQPPQKLYLNNRGFYVLRRLVRSWRVANARAAVRDEMFRRAQPGAKDLLPVDWIPERLRFRHCGAWRVKQARQMLQAPDRTLADLRGVSEWVSAEQMLSFVELALALGGELFLPDTPTGP